ncbi:DUF3103 family protein [Actinacidiphila guanduensis]|uniref:DUF3103 family protein n=1 Tax=Actinacidiphila guanduensis TaxID=310781 RepID=A0A1H0B8Q9_9ACTN|nr:DUF3103 family protein [Actinacidiphila guanduensis]SDN42026.1 Protein of unknown function [Actinacidiphila guanduensis]
MRLSPARRAAIGFALAAASALAVQGLALPVAHARDAAPASTKAAADKATAATASQIADSESATARALAASLSDPAWRARVRIAALGSDQVDLAALTGSGRTPAALKAAVRSADRAIAAAKGLPASTGSLLRLRLGSDAMRTALRPATLPLVAVADHGDAATTATAYDSSGRTHRLSTRHAPQQPVYVVDIDVTKALSTGLAQVDAQLAAKGLKPAARTDAAGTSPNAAPADGGYWATKLNSVWLNDDEEPWIEGDAEIFSIVSGFGLDGVVRVDTVDMPYLDDDHHTYYPNQLIVNWSLYKYDEADLVMMEDDGSTNYEALAQALADALLTITDQGAYVPLVDAILAAMPDSWWTNDPDYVDSWYTLTENSSGTLYGARGNGWMNLSPYWVAAL